MKNLKGKIVDALLILLGLFIAYQLLRKIFGGSWQIDSIIITLLVFNLGISWRLNSNLGKLNAKLEGHIGWHKGKDSKNN
mgnify:CR=1 FL=1